MFDGFNKKIRIKGFKLQIVYPVKDKKTNCSEGGIPCKEFPFSVSSMSLNCEDELVIVPMDEEISLVGAEGLIKNLLKL